MLLLLRLGGDRLDHALHLHEARALDEDAGHVRQFGQHRGDERLDALEVAALHRHGLVAQGEEFLDGAMAGMLAASAAIYFIALAVAGVKLRQFVTR